ncbi:multifunctional CCA addition/repair protein [Pseudomethylobacillus aquaticus]|uniref:Multifunctional CCA protein n=1 Tax=Pseudomethylobacillus aquaticus TaxID=2676064 RepID=A0A3N0UUG2_9PROT|nr:multifunctional CCA addition/repair protein [Pseudomethylobacillus aquaticus]ROH84132.1 multifunctional CCA addition/repair protein [Pseudomethylobacillus aquaticus]
MKSYRVGGAVRDALLGLPVKDVDYVVVGATPEQMVALGYRPVGKDFPVFLHPHTHQEYALARTERKTAKGYKGFQVHAAPEVTLEQDLARRDLTVNAIAEDEHGQLIDPFNGQRDLQARVLRHVSPAFSEDPVRILRAARFAARFHDFTVADETMQLMHDMVQAGEVDALVPERVWQELAKGLMEAKPSRMFEALRACGALQRILPELDRLWGVPQPEKYHPEVDTGVHVMLVVDYAASQQHNLPVRFAALTHDLGKGTTPADMLPRHIGHEERSAELLKTVCERLRVPNDCRDLAYIVARFHGKVHRAEEMRADTLMRLLQDTDALRQPERFKAMLLACVCDARGRTGFEQAAYPQADRLLTVLQAAQAVDAGQIARQLDDVAQIKDAVFAARVAAIKRALTD